jgi:hypothetical protein
MSLGFFSDQCVPRTFSAAIRNGGYGVALLEDFLPIQAKDPDVLLKAQELDCVLITVNGDFSEVTVYPPQNFGGIIAIQFRNHPELLPTIATHLLDFFKRNPDRDFYRGKLFIVEAHRVRIRT